RALLRLPCGGFRLPRSRFCLLQALLERFDAPFVAFLHLPDFLADLRELGILRLRLPGAGERQCDRRSDQVPIEHVCSPLNARTRTAAGSPGCDRVASEEGRRTARKRGW